MYYSEKLDNVQIMADVELIPTTSISVSRLQIQKTSHLS